MKATILDLRYRMKSVLAALERGEPVTVFHRGAKKARLIPIEASAQVRKPSEDPAFGIWRSREDLADPGQHVRKLRKRRFGDL
jgi:antitoxin (DNA-binding transcriptional repressor) of toxin-antitoxin stability system